MRRRRRVLDDKHMDFLTQVRQKATATNRVIVLPEGTEPRTILAVKDVLANKLARPILLGDEGKIAALAKEHSVNLSGVRVVNPETSPQLQEYVAKFMDMRAKRGKPVSEEEAVKTMKNVLYYGAMMVHLGEAEGSLAGAVNETANVVSAAARVIGTKPGIKSASSFFIMILKDKQFGHDGILIYADGGLVTNPDADTLADIAIASAGSAVSLISGFEPRIAMLSFSTKGSAKDPLVDKVVQATEIAKKKAPQLNIDGELQGDAALVASVGQRKAPGSPVAGKANVLIFPNLDCGNISYKLTERLAGAKALGPILQGFAKPVNDLSRGCSADDIADMVAITSAQAE